MLIEGNVKNLRSVQCFIREETHTDDPEEEVNGRHANPFQPGGRVSEDGARIVKLWREGRLGQYSEVTHTHSSPPPPSQPQHFPIILFPAEKKMEFLNQVEHVHFSDVRIL